MMNNNTNDKELYQNLSEPFPMEMEKTLNIGGAKLIYIPVSEVINRLNKILGVSNWSMTVIRCERDVTDIDFVVAHVRLQYTSPNGVVVRDGIGGQKIKRTKQNSIVDLGNEFKGAISDALKKAAQTLGVGLYLARSEEAIEIENVIDSQPPLRDKLNESTETTNHKWQAFLAISKQLSDEQRVELKKLWAEYTDGKPSPTANSATEDEIDFLAAEAIRLQTQAQK